MNSTKGWAISLSLRRAEKNTNKFVFTCTLNNKGLSPIILVLRTIFIFHGYSLRIKNASVWKKYDLDDSDINEWEIVYGVLWV